MDNIESLQKEVKELKSTVMGLILYSLARLNKIDNRDEKQSLEELRDRISKCSDKGFDDLLS